MTLQVMDLWVIVSASLILFMQAGFAAREAGLIRSRNTIDVALKHLTASLVATLFFWLVGYGLVFGATSSGFIGTSKFLLPMDVTDSELAVFFLHVAYCTTAAAIVAGAAAERLRLVPYLFVTAIFAGLIYPMGAHWAWNGLETGKLTGYLGAKWDFHDLAGGTVVHSVGGWFALAGILAVGNRTGRFTPEGAKKIPGSNLGLSALGVFLLWFGWLGFTSGARFGQNVYSVIHILANTVIAGAAGGTFALAIGWSMRKKPELELTMIGVLAGLVSISAGADLFNPTQGVLIGAIGGGVAVGLDLLLVRAKLDDAVGAVPIHLGPGIWGTLAVGIFGHGNLKGQLVGILMVGLWAFVASFLSFKIVGLFTRLRVSEDEEEKGLDATDLSIQTEMSSLVGVMEEQARTGDMSLQANVEPFTEIGRIAKQYNRVMETMRFATAQTESLVRTSLDGLITFNTEGIVTSSNPAASAIFGYGEREFRTVSVTALFAPSRDKAKGRADLGTLLKTFVGQTREVRGIRRDGSEFVMEASFNYVSVGEDEIYTGTFRDITQRKETEAELARAQEEIRRRLEQEMNDAKVVQNALLPVENQFPGCEIARHYQAASETGGDWFGYHFRPDQSSITFYMGDVTGHGLPAALMSGVVCGAVYSAEYTHGLSASGPKGGPEQLLRNTAEVVNRIVLETGKGELLMTMAFVHVNLKSGKLTFLNAGHNMPFLVRNQADVQSLVGRGSRLGESAKPDFEVTQVNLTANDIVVLFTDGLIENPGPDGRTFNVRDFKKALLARQTATQIRDELVLRTKEIWQDRPAVDDHSILVFRWTPN